MSASEQRYNFTIDAPFSFDTTFYVLLDSVYGYISAPGTYNYSVVGDVDTYFVKTVPGYTYAMIVTEGIALSDYYGIEDAINPHINLFDSSGTLTKIGYDYGEYTGFTFYATDYTYYVDVTAPTIGGYQLTFVNNDIREANGTGEFIYVGNNYGAALDTASDIDKFAFSGIEGKRYYFDLTSDVPDMFFQIVNAFGEQLTYGTVDGSGLYYLDVESSAVFDVQVSSNSFYGTGEYSFYFTDNLGAATFFDPSYSGTLAVGQTITSSIQYQDADSNSDNEISTLWFIDDGDLENGLELSLDDYSITNELEIISDWAGKTLYFSKFFVDDAGNIESSLNLNIDLESDLTGVIGLYEVGVIEGLNRAPTGSLVISGTTAEGETLTLDTSSIADVDGVGTFSYVWMKDGAVLAGETGSTYTLTQADVRSVFSASVSYVDGLGVTETLSSETTAEVVNVNDDPTGVLVISGTAEKGSTLTLDSSSIADEDGLGEFSITWLSDDTPITGATEATYTLTEDEVDSVVTALIEYTDGQGTVETVTSSATSAVKDVIVESIGALSAVNTGSGSNMVLEFYADDSLVGASVTSFDAVVTFDTSEASYVSADIQTGYLGFPNEADGVINLSGISLSGGSSADPLFTLTLADQNASEDLAVYVSDVAINGTSLEGSTLLIGGPDTVDVTAAVISRSGASLSDVALSFDDGSDVITFNTNESGLSAASITSGSDLTVTGSLDYAKSSKSVTSQDALDALRLSVGMDTQSGTSTAFDYIAADFNQDGKVSSQDALAILKYAVGLTTTEQAEWVFVDTNGDYSDINRTNTNHDEGITIADLTSATELSLTGILIGDVNDSYSGLIA